jgi:endonuclease YncB( thermonuclease family)
VELMALSKGGQLGPEQESRRNEGVGIWRDPAEWRS